jgi:hypothetical protein
MIQTRAIRSIMDYGYSFVDNCLSRKKLKVKSNELLVIVG